MVRLEVDHGDAQHQRHPQQCEGATAQGLTQRNLTVRTHKSRREQQRQQAHRQGDAQPGKTEQVGHNHNCTRQGTQQVFRDAVAAAGIEHVPNLPGAQASRSSGKRHKNRLVHQAQHQQRTETNTHANGGGQVTACFGAARLHRRCNGLRAQLWSRRRASLFFRFFACTHLGFRPRAVQLPCACTVRRPGRCASWSVRPVPSQRVRLRLHRFRCP